MVIGLLVLGLFSISFLQTEDQAVSKLYMGHLMGVLNVWSASLANCLPPPMPTWLVKPTSSAPGR